MMHRMKLLTIIVSCMVSAITHSTFATTWIVDHGVSTVQFSGTHAGNPFMGTFDSWTAEIRHDPITPSASSAVVIFDIGSAKTGNGLYDGTLIGEDWFNIERFPQATFRSTGFIPRQDGMLEAAGMLEIKGKALPMTLIFDLKIDGDTARMTARHAIDRLSWGLGAVSDPEATWVSRTIVIDISLVAHREQRSPSFPARR